MNKMYYYCLGVWYILSVSAIWALRFFVSLTWECVSVTDSLGDFWCGVQVPDCILMVPLLFCNIPTVILFHLFGLDHSPAPWEEWVMGYEGNEALSGANGSSWFEWPIYEHFMWVMECSSNVLTIASNTTGEADAVNVSWKRVCFIILEQEGNKAAVWQSCTTAYIFNVALNYFETVVCVNFQYNWASLYCSFLSQSLLWFLDNHTVLSGCLIPAIISFFI